MDKQKKRVNLSSDTSNAIEKQNSINRIINESTPFDVIEAYKATRTNIMFSLNNEKGCKKIIISSATSGEGKSTTCINIAKTFAETGARVLLMDADLRAPRVHKYLKIANEKGLSNVLAGFDELNDCIIKRDDINFDCITSGALPPNPVELISSNAMVELFEELEKRYDYIFIDTPPITIVTEAVLLSKYATGVIIVTRQKYTMFKLVDRAINSLKFADARIIGFILNDADDRYIYGSYKSGRTRRLSRSRYRYGRYGYDAENSENKSYSKFIEKAKHKKSDGKTNDEQ